jgi:cyanate lyase
MDRIGASKEWTTAALLGQMTLNHDQVQVARELFAREHDPKGDRVNVVLSGKFLPYKTY